MSSGEQSTLDCQDCGRIVMVLTPAEAQAVSYNPYNYIVYCGDCKAARRREGGFG